MTEREVIVDGYHYRKIGGRWFVCAVGYDHRTPVTWPHTIAVIERIAELERATENLVPEQVRKVLKPATAAPSGEGEG